MIVEWTSRMYPLDLAFLKMIARFGAMGHSSRAERGGPLYQCPIDRWAHRCKLSNHFNANPVAVSTPYDGQASGPWDWLNILDHQPWSSVDVSDFVVED
jgi:hypothetical protein